MGKVTFRHEFRFYAVDERLGASRARNFLDGKAPSLNYPWKGGIPCVWKEGEKIVIEDHRLWIQILTVNFGDGQWDIKYLLADHRPNFMAKSSGITHDQSKAMPTKYTDPDGVEREEVEGVPRDWHDKGVAHRKMKRQEAIADERSAFMDSEESRKMVVEQAEAEVDKLAARVKQVGKQSGRRGRYLTGMLDDIYARLAEEERDMREDAA